jgi:protease I
MAHRIDGKRIAFLATDGVEQVELDRPWQAVTDAGGRPELVSLESGQIQAFNHLDKGDKRTVDITADKADPNDYDALVLPGGVANGDFVRGNPDAVRFAKAFFTAGKPVAAICHAAWTLVEADVVRGRTMTSWPTLQTDLRNAGATWVDKEVVVDQGLVSSRKPDDLDAFCDKMLEEFAEGAHAGQRGSACALSWAPRRAGWRAGRGAHGASGSRLSRPGPDACDRSRWPARRRAPRAARRGRPGADRPTAPRPADHRG